MDKNQDGLVEVLIVQLNSEMVNYSEWDKLNMKNIHALHCKIIKEFKAIFTDVMEKANAAARAPGTGNPVFSGEDGIENDLRKLKEIGNYLGIDTQNLSEYITASTASTDGTTINSLNRIMIQMGDEIQEAVIFVSNIRNDSLKMKYS